MSEDEIKKLADYFAKPLLCAGRIISTKLILKRKWEIVHNAAHPCLTDNQYVQCAWAI